MVRNIMQEHRFFRDPDTQDYREARKGDLALSSRELLLEDADRSLRYWARFFMWVSVIGLIVSALYVEEIQRNGIFSLVILCILAITIIASVLSVFRLSSLRKRGNYTRAVMRSVLDGSLGKRFVCGQDGAVVYSNEKFDDFLRSCAVEGRTPLGAVEDFLGRESVLENMYKTAIKSGEAVEEIPVTKNGQTHWYYIHAYHIHGLQDHVHFRIDDITDKKKFDEAVQMERQRLLDFMDNALVGFFSVNQNGDFLFANATLARLLGLESEVDFSEYKLHDFLVEAPKDAASYDLVDGGGADQSGDIILKDIYGREFLVSVSHTVVYESEDQLYTQSVVRNLMPEKEMRAALRASEDRFHRFFEDAPTGILVLSSDARVEEANQSFRTMFANEDQKILAASLYDLIIQADVEEVKKVFADLLKKERFVKTVEVSLKNTDELTVQLSISRLLGTQSFLVHVSDLSKQKQLESQFTQSQKMQAVGLLAGGVAHDFNNLLTAMIGFCDLLLERHRPGDPSFQDLMQIKQNANRAADLVGQLLAFSRQQTLRPKPLNMSDVLSDLSNLLRRLIGVNVSLDLRHGRNLWPLKADKGQMEQVFINLVVNARDAMNHEGGILIETTNYSTDKETELLSDVLPVGEWVRIEVKDQGCGISEENLRRIFDPFFTTKKLGEGTGLGLSTVYGIISQTGGYLDVISVEGQGTSFVIFLPRHIPSEKDLEEQREEETKTKDLTGSEVILLVEDEESVRKFSARTLTNKGYEVLEAEHGLEALDVYEQAGNSVDLIITDVMMPEMDGPTMVGKVQEINPSQKIMFVSGFSEDRISDHAGDNIYFLAKPFSLKDLAAKVKDVLGDD